MPTRPRPCCELVFDQTLPAYRAVPPRPAVSPDRRDAVPAVLRRPRLRGGAPARAAVERDRPDRHRRAIAPAERLSSAIGRSPRSNRSGSSPTRTSSSGRFRSTSAACGRRFGPEREVVAAALELLEETDADLLRQACFDPANCSTSWRSTRGPTTSTIRPTSGPTITSASGIRTRSTTRPLSPLRRAAGDARRPDAAADRYDRHPCRANCCSKRRRCWPARS